MNTNKSLALLVGLVLIVGGIAGFGLEKLFSPAPVSVSTQASPSGSTFSSAKVALVAVNVATVTPASLYNSDANDRVVTNIWMATQTTGGTTTQYYIQAATSSNPYNVVGNTNYVYSSPGVSGSTGISISAKGFFQIASSTTNQFQSTLGTFVWPSGTYLNFVISSSTNLTSHLNQVFTSQIGATNNNDGNLGSTTSGVIGVSYLPQ